LKELNLADNKLTKFPPLEKLPSLQVLDLAQNSFIINSNSFFPPSLETLRLSGNDLSFFPKETLISLSNLTSLDLSENRLAIFPDPIFNMPCLERLNFMCNDISTIPAKPNLPVLWSKIYTLTLSFNSLTSLPFELSRLPKLKTLDLRGNAFDPNNPENERFFASLLERGIFSPTDSLVSDKIMDGLYLGCRECAKNRHFLQKEGITHIVTVAQFKPLYPHVRETKTNKQDKQMKRKKELKIVLLLSHSL
jgi:hypothetical protein